MAKVKPWMWGAGAIALAGGVWYFTRKKDAPKNGNRFQGTTKFPTPESVGFGLLELGYPTSVGTPGWSLNNAQTRTQVQEFQRDYNKVRHVIHAHYGVTLGNKDIRTDGHVDKATVQAVENAVHLIDVNREDMGTWPEVVEDAWSPPDAEEPPPPVG